jgi:transposase-like protein
MNEQIWINYLHKKGIIKEGLENFKSNQKEIREFQSMLYRLKKSEKNIKCYVCNSPNVVKVFTNMRGVKHHYCKECSKKYLRRFKR